MIITVRALVTSALQELGVLGVGETAEASIVAQVVGQVNRIRDNWNADRAVVYADAFPTFTITPSLQPHTIGPTGATITVDSRPVSIEGASVTINTVNYPISIRTAEWWQARMQPTLSSEIPTDLYYDATWPNGSIYLWPVPTAAYDVQLWIRGLFDSVAIGDSLDMPPGYVDALILTTAEASASGLGAVVSDQTMKAARQARARIAENNTMVPTITTLDAGMTGVNRRGTWNYQTGRAD